MKKGVLEQIGTIGVDAGLCWVGDPCYCVTPDADNHPAQTWDEFCEKTKEGDHWIFEAGICVTTAYGDGEYPVFIERNQAGRITKLLVVFDE